MKIRALYGVSSDPPPFAGRGAAEQVAWLRSVGRTAIFGGTEAPDFVAATHAAALTAAARS
jgi:hypothetical protein